MATLTARACASAAGWSDSNFEVGISSVAAPLFDHTGNVAGGVNVSGATSALDGATRRKQIGTALSRAAYEISRRIGYAPTSRSNFGHSSG